MVPNQKNGKQQAHIAVIYKVIVRHNHHDSGHSSEQVSSLSYSQRERF